MPKIINPLSDLINDEVYITLRKEGLLDKRAVREYQIQSRFKQLVKSEMPAVDAIGILFTEYPDLDFSTINKIVYQKN